MSASLVTLERELERAALDFASALVLAALRAKVEDLPTFRRDAAAFNPEQFPVDLPRRAPRVVARPPAVPERRVRVAKKSTEPKPRTRLRARPDEAESDDGGANTITDPSLLLAAIESDSRTTASRVRAPRTSAFFAAAEEDNGPALRPGERLQRTAGGTVILRRGRG